MLYSLLVRSLGLRPQRTRTDRAKRPRPVAPRRTFVPQLLALEDRAVPATFTVTNLLDNAAAGSLRWAVGQANANPNADLIRFAGGLQGTITLGSELSVTQDVTLDGPGAAQITLSGGGTTRVFNISGSSTDVTIADLTIANGRASGVTFVSLFGPLTGGGGILNNQSHLTLDGVTLTGNQVDGGGVNLAAGGAILNVFGGSLTTAHCTFDANRTSNGFFNSVGGAIYCDASSAALATTRFANNQASAAAASFGFGGAISTSGPLTVSACTFEDNVSRGGTDGGLAFGGAIDVGPSLFGLAAPLTVAIDLSTFTGNRALAGAGAAGADGGFALGGALFLVTDGAQATVTRSLFAGNLARGGNGGVGGNGADADAGAIYLNESEAGNPTVLSVSDTHFTGNRARGGDGGAGGAAGLALGGAILNDGSILQVLRSTFSDNEARGGDGGNGGAGQSGGPGGAGVGGAINATGFGVPTTSVTDSVFLGNRGLGGNGGAGGVGGDGGLGGAGAGGGVVNLFGMLTVSDSLFLGNQATGGAGGAAGAGGTGGHGGLGAGGGVLNGFFVFGGTAVLSDTTLIGNQASGGAGGAGGGNGGEGLGGGLYNGGGGTSTVNDSTIVGNRARGGPGGSGGGSAGVGTGGGIFNDALIVVDALTDVFLNQADVSDDCFGCP